MRRFVIAAIILLGTMRAYGSARSDETRAAAAIFGVLGLGLATLVRRRGDADDPGNAGDAAEDHDGDDDEELLRGVAVRGGSLRSPGGTLVLRRRALLFTHVKGELSIPLEQVTRVEKGRTLLLFDNQVVLALRDGRREIFQLAEGRDLWLDALRSLVSSPRGAYR